MWELAHPTTFFTSTTATLSLIRDTGTGHPISVVHGRLWTTIFYRQGFANTGLNRSEDIVTLITGPIATIDERVLTDVTHLTTAGSTKRRIARGIGMTEDLENTRETARHIVMTEDLENTTETAADHWKQTQSS
jgi:hypothetical protein